MLDLTKPVRTIEDNISGTVVGKKLDGRIIVEGPDGFLFVRSAELLENIPEPEVIEGIVSVFQFCGGEKYLSTASTATQLCSAKVTYTEGAENPWQIEEV